jgi:hypothetical protein
MDTKKGLPAEAPFRYTFLFNLPIFIMALQDGQHSGGTQSSLLPGHAQVINRIHYTQPFWNLLRAGQV